MWHWKGKGHWVLWAIVIPLLLTDGIGRYALQRPVARWVYVLDIAVAALVCFGIAAHARRRSDGEEHSLQGLGLNTWGVAYLAIAVFGAWLVSRS